MMYQRKSEEALDDSPVAVIYRSYAHIILNYLYRYVTSREDADDLMLEVFVAALDNQVWITWSGEEQLAWLRRVAHNKAVDHVRRAARHPALALDDAIDMLIDDDDLMPEEVALRNEDYVQLRAHLAKLPVLQQEIVRLRFADGLRTKEIAQVLNRSDNVVRVLLSRALNLLRGIYNQPEEGA